MTMLREKLAVFRLEDHATPPRFLVAVNEDDASGYVRERLPRYHPIWTTDEFVAENVLPYVDGSMLAPCFHVIEVTRERRAYYVAAPDPSAALKVLLNGQPAVRYPTFTISHVPTPVIITPEALKKLTAGG
jgi:hypothetical protein